MKAKGPWSPDQIQRFLEEARIPVRLACNGASGHPVMASLWFEWEADRIWCATQCGAHVVSLLKDDPRCAFEVSIETPPYRGIRGTATAQLHAERGEEVLRRLLGRYVGDLETPFARSLLVKSATETAIAIEPRTLVSWDFRERMGAAAPRPSSA